MTAERVETVPASIEHLDFAPMCSMTMHQQEDGPADYSAMTRCGCSLLTCSACVARKVAEGKKRFSHSQCGAVWGIGVWLDFVTLHPLGGTP